MGKFSSAKMTGAQDVKAQNAHNTLIDLLETGYVAESMMGGHKIRVTVSPSDGLMILRDGVKIFSIDTTTGDIHIAGTATEDDMQYLQNYVAALDAAAVKAGVSYAGVAMTATSGFTSSAVVNGKTVIVNMSSAGGGLNITVDGVQVGGISLINGVPTLVAGTLTNVPSDPEVFAKIGAMTVSGSTVNGLLIFKKSLSTVYASCGLLIDSDGTVSLGDMTYRRFAATPYDTQILDQYGLVRFSTYNNKSKIQCGGGINSYVEVTPSQVEVVVNGVQKAVWS